MVLIGEEGISNSDIPIDIGVGNVIEDSIATDYVGNLKKIIIEPKILKKTCAKQGLEIENIGQC
jgi:hypothetical protein